jgi:hypothetical protein
MQLTFDPREWLVCFERFVTKHLKKWHIHESSVAFLFTAKQDLLAQYDHFKLKAGPDRAADLVVLDGLFKHLAREADNYLQAHGNRP